MIPKRQRHEDLIYLFTYFAKVIAGENHSLSKLHAKEASQDEELHQRMLRLDVALGD